jgi:hypothetical protein
VSTPTPALVTQRGARRLPRVALLLLCAAYLLPGIFARDPWRNADLVAYGQMAAIAEGRTPWLAPALGGVAGDTALLPHWLGAVAIGLLAPLVDADNAARVPFVLLLAATLALVWYTTFHLARTEAAQPVPFAFGGEAEPVDYARAIADGALLALIATLGLLQLGHETRTGAVVRRRALPVVARGRAIPPLDAAPGRGRRTRRHGRQRCACDGGGDGWRRRHRLRPLALRTGAPLRSLGDRRHRRRGRARHGS